jgi:hypothetical protein
MATVLDYAKCKQCDYECGDYEINCRTDEWDFNCRRCGYSESREWIATEDGSRIGWRHETLDGHGALWATRPGVGVSTFYSLRSAREVDEAARQLQDGIAKGELDGNSSYVTRWNADAKRVEVVAGKWLPLADEDQQRQDDNLKQKSSSEIDNVCEEGNR